MTAAACPRRTPDNANSPRPVPLRIDGDDRQIGAAFAVGQTCPMQIVAVLGDITSQQVDAIVNAANSALLPGGGVDGAIHDAAGDELLAACIALGGCEVGDAKATPGFKLAAQWIIHTVGPVYQGGHRGEAALLASCYRRSLEVADSLGVRSIAFPAISTGAFGYPEQDAARIAIGTLREATTTVALTRLIAFDRRNQRQMSDLLAHF